MKNTIKKIIVLLFSAVFSLSAFGMIDFVQDRKVMLSDHHNIVIKESVKKKIEDHNIALEMVAELYNSAIEDPSICYFDGKAIIACSNKLIDINILKSDGSIVDFYLNDEENN